MKRLMMKVSVLLIFSALLNVQIHADANSDIGLLNSIKTIAADLNSKTTAQKNNINPHVYIKKVTDQARQIDVIGKTEQNAVINLFKDFCNTQETKDMSKRYVKIEPLNTKVNHLIARFEAPAAVSKTKKTQTNAASIAADAINTIAITTQNTNDTIANINNNAQLTPEDKQTLGQEITTTETTVIEKELNEAAKAATISEGYGARIKKLASTAAAKTKAGAYAAGGYAAKPFRAAKAAVTPYSQEEVEQAKAQLKNFDYAQKLTGLTTSIADNTKTLKSPAFLSIDEVLTLGRQISAETNKATELSTQYVSLQTQAGTLTPFLTKVVNGVTSKQGMAVIGGIITAGLVTAALYNRESLKNLNKQDIGSFFTSGLTSFQEKTGNMVNSIWSYVPNMSGIRQQYLPNVSDYMPTATSMKERITGITPMGAAKAAGAIGLGYALGGKEGAIIAASGPGTPVFIALDYYTKWKALNDAKNVAQALLAQNKFEKAFDQLNQEEQLAVIAKIEEQINSLTSQYQEYKKIQTTANPTTN